MLRHQTAHRHTDVSPIVDWKLKERNHLYKLWELIFIGLPFQTTHSIKLKACCLSQVQLCYVTAWYCKSRLNLWSSAVQKLQWQLMVLWGSALWQKQKLSPVLPSAISSSYFFCLSHKRMPLSILFLFTKKKKLYVRGSLETERDHSIFQKLLMCDSIVCKLHECSICFSFHLRHPCPVSKASTLNLNKLHLSFKINLPSSSDGMELVSQWRGVIKHWTSVMPALPWNKLKNKLCIPEKYQCRQSSKRTVFKYFSVWQEETQRDSIKSKSLEMGFH